jgi:hypothetical protein
MIIVKILGGMGNQMFQYAMAKALALRTSQELRIDITSLKAHGERRYSFPEFSLTVGEARFNDYKTLGLGLFSYPLVRLKKHPAYYLENNFSFNPSLSLRKNSIYLDGYFQSEKYFVDYENQIRQDFNFKKNINSNEQKYLNEMSGYENISLHIRRGDYVTNTSNQTLLGSIPLNYYLDSVQFLISKLAKPKFFLFSDDPNWVKENLKIKSSHVHVIGNVGHESWRDMRLMQNCDHHIIANSSFSWWGAWLNNKKNKIVLTPDPWFKDRTINSKDLIPESWIKIKF